MAGSALRVIAGMFTLQEILNEREKISLEIQKYIDQESDEWGVRITNFMIKDIILS